MNGRAAALGRSLPGRGASSSTYNEACGAAPAATDRDAGGALPVAAGESPDSGAPARSGRPSRRTIASISPQGKEPIRFRERERGPGATKPGAGSTLELLRNVWRPHPASRRVLVRYGLTGIAGALINLGTFQVLLELGLHKFLASPIAIELSIVANFLMHNYWTFADRDMIGGRRVRGLKYNLASLVTLALNYAAFVGLSILFPQAPPVLLQGCCIAPIALLNYSVSSRWTFRGTPSKRPAGPRPSA